MTIKKAELHVHLEGAIHPSLAKKLAQKNKHKIPDGVISADGCSYLSNDFLHFLKVYDTVAEVIKSPEDYYEITFDYLKHRALADTIYVELMYSPDHAEMVSNIPSIEHLKAIQQAVDDAEHKFGIVGRIIQTGVRHFGPEKAERIAREIAKSSVPCVTGFGLGGDEANYPPKLFEKAYKIAADAGLQCTVHAGEFADHNGMLEAIKYLPIKRIGHGVRAIYSQETMDLVKAKNIALEVCPTSNLFLGVFPSMDAHPLPKLLDYGINISINSDDPPFFSTSLEQEYERVQESYGYTDETMKKITDMALDAAFIDEKTRVKLKSKNTI